MLIKPQFQLAMLDGFQDGCHAQMVKCNVWYIRNLKTYNLLVLLAKYVCISVLTPFLIKYLSKKGLHMMVYKMAATL